MSVTVTFINADSMSLRQAWMEFSCKSSSARSETLLFCMIRVLAFLKITDGCSTRKAFVNAS